MIADSAHSDITYPPTIIMLSGSIFLARANQLSSFTTYLIVPSIYVTFRLPVQTIPFDANLHPLKPPGQMVMIAELRMPSVKVTTKEWIILFRKIL
jgi:hypothetical protein